ncbi:MAG: VWA domain-containing protein [Salinirussus sp.]
MTDEPYFPFNAIVDRSDMKDGLLCNAVAPDIGGVLISGTRGTAKSTAARSLAHVLPSIEAVADCPYHCHPTDRSLQCADCAERDLDGSVVEEISTPFVTLPIGATEDRVLGTLDIESAIQEGRQAFEPGLLAKANRGILYVDEVNLLDDHLVDVLLDAVASGTNRVEREGVSVEHPANVLIVGTMNPEEGELRPQLLDRFGLAVDLEDGLEAEDRKTVVRRRTRFEADPAGFAAEWEDAEEALAERIIGAQERYPTVQLDDELLDRIVGICLEHEVAGLRADIVIHRTARALAALDGREAATVADVDRAAELALGHRSNRRRDTDSQGSGSPGDGADDGSGRPDKPDPEDLPDLDQSGSEDDVSDTAMGSQPTDDGDDGDDHTGSAAEDRVFPIGENVETPDGTRSIRNDLAREADPGRGHGRTTTADGHGAYIRARRPRGSTTDIAIDATVRAAAPYQGARSAENDCAIALRPADVREPVRAAPARNLILFVVDASGSMGANDRMTAVKGAIRSLLADADRDRDAVGLIGFRADDAETLLTPTSDVSEAMAALAELPTGGRTPLAAGLQRGLDVIRSERNGRLSLAPLLVVLSDGRANHVTGDVSPTVAAMDRARDIAAEGVPALCFDTETGPVRLGLVRRLADAMEASYHRLDELEPAAVAEPIRDAVTGGFEG